MAGIYLHIPFCKQSCHYCDFHFSTRQDQKGAMVQAIGAELSLQKGYLAGETVQTIYFGGGTPSLLSADELQELLVIIKKSYHIAADAEISLEANPDDLSDDYLSLLHRAGINRLSIGIQSFDDTVLRYLNRAHDAWAAVNCIAAARRHGFQNISIDLIYAIPGQDHSLWRRNIERATDLEPEHISAYSLTIEENTAFGRWASKGKLKVVDDEFAATQLELLVAALAEKGYQQYEVSNFSLPGYESRHNSSYWRQQKYLGVGPSAHSYNGDSRQFNISNNAQYLKALAQEKIPATIEMLTTADKVNDYLMTTLRTVWGANLSFLRENLGHDLEKTHSVYLKSLISRDLATLENGVLVLTNQGKLLADKISSDLFIIHEPG